MITILESWTWILFNCSFLRWKCCNDDLSGNQFSRKCDGNIWSDRQRRLHVIQKKQNKTKQNNKRFSPFAEQLMIASTYG